MNVVIRRVSANNTLSLSQYFALSNIPTSGISMTELSIIVGIDKSTLTRNINILLQSGLVEKRKSDFDKRGYTVFLSSKGDDLINKLHDEIEIIINQFIETVSSDSKQDFINILETINWKASCYINEL
tara:strand:- start:2094 stop:2477 length:384 start_codon:yes stop_codon:yes gene_type:complete